MSWDTPHRDRPDLVWYHPRVLAWLAIDIPYIISQYIKHKYNLLTAERWVVAMQVSSAMQTQHHILTNENNSLQARQNAVTALRQLVQLSEELNISDEYEIPHYTEQYERYKDM